MATLMDRVHGEVAEWMQGTQDLKVERVHHLRTEDVYNRRPIAVIHYSAHNSPTIQQFGFYDTVEELLEAVSRWKENDNA